MFKNGMRPVHPGDILLEDYIKPMGVSVRAVAIACMCLIRVSAKLPKASAGGDELHPVVIDLLV